MDDNKKKTYYVIKLKTGYIEYVERYENGITQYGTTKHIIDAKVYYYVDKTAQHYRLQVVAKNVGYVPKAIEIEL